MNETANAQGCLLGLACGDALSRPAEFKSPEEIASQHDDVTKMLGHGTHGQPPGKITGDTEMTLCIAESLVDHRHGPLRLLKRAHQLGAIIYQNHLPTADSELISREKFKCSCDTVSMYNIKYLSGGGCLYWGSRDGSPVGPVNPSSRT